MDVLFSIEKEITFAQTDMAGVMHFSEFFPLMEECEHRFLRSLDIPVKPEGNRVVWPRRNCACQYHRPLRFQDRVSVRLTISNFTTRSVVYDFTFIESNSGELAAEGRITTICCRVNPDSGRFEATSIPPETLERLQAATKTKARPPSSKDSRVK